MLFEHPDHFQHLMRINADFCVAWANAQLAAGATAICYFDPVSSTSMIPPDLYRQTGYQVASTTLARIKGPTATHLASGRCIGIADLLATTGTAAVGVSCDEDLKELKAAFQGKLSLLGNLNVIAMRNWDAETARQTVRRTIAEAAHGGGFILSDTHGEIPFQVPDEVLFAISEAVEEFGRYPIQVFHD
jgi:uroporphyrinogen decarboxylase